MTAESDLDLAQRAVLAGAGVAMRYFAGLANLPREQKSDGSVVTEADRATEAAIRGVLSSARPDDAILGEEDGQSGQGSRRWIIDPIDGTAVYVDGGDFWLVLLALESRREIVAGVAAVPAQGRIWWAARGGGAYEADLSGHDVTNARRISVDRTGPDVLPGGRFGVVPEPSSVTRAERDLVAPVGAVTRVLPWGLHPALLVARGDLDLAVQTRGQVWDFAALSLIVEEAGGVFSGTDGVRTPGPAHRCTPGARPYIPLRSACSAQHLLGSPDARGHRPGTRLRPQDPGGQPGGHA